VHGPECALARKHGFDFKGVASGPIYGLSLRTAGSLLKLAAGSVAARRILGEFKPDVLVGTGGYTCAGVLIAGWSCGKKIVLHEQNVVPGRTNRLLSRIADKICVTFEESRRYFSESRVVVTGLPVRKDIIAGIDRQTAAERFGLDGGKRTVLAVGGSQGAVRINRLMIEAVSLLCEKGIQVIHQTGERGYGDIVGSKPDVQGYVILPYIEDMTAAYSAADIVVSRAGASAISEITVRGLPSVLIPYPYAQGDHQAKNAQAVANAGAAMVVDEKELDGRSLAAILLDLFDNESKLQSMADASRKLAKPNAAADVAKVVIEVMRGES